MGHVCFFSLFNFPFYLKKKRKKKKQTKNPPQHCDEFGSLSLMVAVVVVVVLVPCTIKFPT